MTRLSDLAPDPYDDHELIAPLSERFYVRSLKSEKQYSEWSDAASHVAIINTGYMLRERFFTPQIVSMTYLFPAGEIHDQRRSIDDLYEGLQKNIVPPEILNHDPNSGPRYVEGVERGERVTTVNSRPADAVFWPNARVRTTPIGAVKLFVQIAEGDESIGDLLTHYDEEIVRRTRTVSPSDLRLVDRDAGTHYSLVTDGSRPCVTDPVSAAGPNRLNIS